MGLQEVLVVAAGSENLEGVRNITEAMLCGDPLGPCFHGGSFDFDRATALTAYQVVVVTTAARTVCRLALTRAQHVDITLSGERGEGAVDRGQPDAGPGCSHPGVQILG